MFRRAAFCIALAGLILLPGCGEPRFPAVPAESVEALVTGQIQAIIDARKASGAVVAVLRGNMVERYAIGTLSPRDARSPDSTTLFEIGSITKSFTTALLAIMVDRGEVTLETPVVDLLPPGTRMPSFAGIPITLGDLASHLSGLPGLPSNLNPWRNINDPYARYSTADLYEFLAAYRLKRAPGEKFEYSNLGMGLLGLALAQKSGVPYEQLLREWLIGPLALPDTYVSNLAAPRERMAPPLEESLWSFFGVPPGRGHNWTLGLFEPAGSITASLDGVVAYLLANMNPIGTVLEPVADLLHTRRFTIDDEFGIALGWSLLTSPASGHEIVWHNGETGGYSAFAGFIPQSRVGVVILCNAVASPHIDQAAFNILEGLDAL